MYHQTEASEKTTWGGILRTPSAKLKIWRGCGGDNDGDSDGDEE